MTIREFLPKHSSNVLKATYNSSNKTLQIIFTSKAGDTSPYNYYRVPEDLFDKLIASDRADKKDSVGKFINREIKPIHEFEQVLGYKE